MDRKNKEKEANILDDSSFTKKDKIKNDKFETLFYQNDDLEKFGYEKFLIDINNKSIENIVKLYSNNTKNYSDIYIYIFIK